MKLKLLSKRVAPRLHFVYVSLGAVYEACPISFRNLIIKCLSVGPQPKFLYQLIALNVLFQMRYGDLICAKRLQSESPK